MNKFIISILIVFNSLLLAKYEDETPSKTTNEDLIILEDFKNLLYDKTKTTLTQCNQQSINTFIYSHKIETIDYNRLLVDLVGRVNSSETIQSESENIYSNRDKATVSLIAKYPIFDKKTDIEMKKKQMDYKHKLVDEVSKYCILKHKVEILQHDIELLNLKQLRAKAREDTGQINLDERIELIENIIKTKNDFSEKQIELESIRLKLINKVHPTSIERLKELL